MEKLEAGYRVRTGAGKRHLAKNVASSERDGPDEQERCRVEEEFGTRS
jgi:hypothetical protein